MLGTVTMLRRYPVKSMLGEDVPASDVTSGGLTHDRALALVHQETGKVASAKNPRLWRGMLKLAATVADSGVQITLPDGGTIWSTDPGIDTVLSELLGQPVVLTGTPPPGAMLDRAEPEEVLRRGVTARVPVENTATRLEPYPPTGQLLMTSEDGYAVRLVNMKSHAKTKNFVPTQLGPIAILVTSAGIDRFEAPPVARYFSTGLLPGVEVDDVLALGAEPAGGERRPPPGRPPRRPAGPPRRGGGRLRAPRHGRRKRG